MAGIVKTVSWRRLRPQAHARRVTNTLAGPAGMPAQHADSSALRGGGSAAADGPIARVVAASLATGLLGAAALTLGLFGGAPEHVITGSALLAFAAGWGLLAVLSSRLTSRPQRWALGPAAALAVVGAGLLALAPGGVALTAGGWFWAPQPLRLAAWTPARARATLPGRARVWLLYPVLAAMALGAVGGGYQSVRV